MLQCNILFCFRHSKPREAGATLDIPPLPVMPPIEKAPLINVPSSNYCQDWSKLINNQSHSDIVFHLGAQVFYAHRYVLCSASEVFRRVFEIKQFFLVGATSESKSVEIKYKSLAECPGWDTPDKIESVTASNINAGQVEGFVSLQEK